MPFAIMLFVGLVAPWREVCPLPDNAAARCLIAPTDAHHRLWGLTLLALIPSVLVWMGGSGGTCGRLLYLFSLLFYCRPLLALFFLGLAACTPAPYRRVCNPFLVLPPLPNLNRLLPL